MILLVFFNYVNINLIVLERKDINEYIKRKR
jgi:thioredoxin 1